MSLKDQVHLHSIQACYPQAVETSYQKWIQTFISYHDGKHPILMGSNELKSFLLYLNYTLHLPRQAMKHAFCALEFLYNKVFDTAIPRFEELV